MQTGVAPVPPHRMTGAQFRSFQESRPDRERWELVKGTPMMKVRRRSPISGSLTI
jgi:hypothetical protein